MGMYKKLSLAVALWLGSQLSTGYTVGEEGLIPPDVYRAFTQTTPAHFTALHYEVHPFQSGDTLHSWALRLAVGEGGGGGDVDWQPFYEVVGIPQQRRIGVQGSELVLENLRDIRAGLHADVNPLPIRVIVDQIDTHIGGGDEDTLSCVTRFHEAFTERDQNLLDGMAACQAETGGDGHLISQLQLSRQFVSLDQPLVGGIVRLRTRWGGQGSLDTQTTHIETLIGIDNDSEKIIPTFSKELANLSKAARTFKQANLDMQKSLGGMPTFSNQGNLFYALYLLNSTYTIPPEDTIPEGYPSFVTVILEIGKILGGGTTSEPWRAANLLLDKIGNPSSTSVLDGLQQLIPVLAVDTDNLTGAVTAVEGAVGERGEEGDIVSGIHKQRKRIDKNEPTFSGAVDSVKGDLGTPLETLKEGTEFLLHLAGADPQEPVQRDLNWRMQRGIELTQKGATGWLDGTFALHTLVGGGS